MFREGTGRCTTFHELSNVLTMADVSGWTEGMAEVRATRMATTIEQAARGEPLLNPIARRA